MRRPPSPSSRWQSARACRRVGGVVEGKVAGGRNSAAVAPPALIEYRALRAAAQSGSGASIATSLAAAVVAHLVAALEASLYGARRRVSARTSIVRHLRVSAAVAPPALIEYRALRAAAQSGSAVDGHVERQFMFERPPGFKQK
ncbi:hypothetical protein EMIHUDRAFT_198179 [Emiliania huxleyi CCMP1516]|uniref:Histone H2A n=2 Tax=Emiliania huxleyi TaxID=2903 RepID=A0A0D3IEE1_EMIH1|nr:hypothetical protein EMIHUDRAFT_198179 [Emiliania huxleyi CCMP1516]EOD09626.1 hypothetical protein EMIHUDRAFT_198179 [Emiliania huxleyi CCMP1516]|eukprot:XP_005762055.1 hypothetical protein EMIHUDRAFT_198179 [Emiliania huxleyi CCMP1516]